MATINPEVVQGLLGQIAALRKTIEAAGDVACAQLKDVNLEDALKAIPQEPEGTLDAQKWAGLDADAQDRLRTRLAQVRDSLYAAAGCDGPADPKHIMYSEYASNRTIILWTLSGLVLVVALLSAIWVRWPEATGAPPRPRAETVTETPAESGQARLAVGGAGEAEPGEPEGSIGGLASAGEEASEGSSGAGGGAAADTAPGGAAATVGGRTDGEGLAAGGACPSEGTVLTMVLLLGALGGSLHYVSSLVKFIGNRQLKRSWLPHYLARPVVGSALALIVYMLMTVGTIAAPGASGGRVSTADLNYHAIYSFAALTGLFAKTALEKLHDIFRTAFSTSEPPSKDKLGSDK